LKEIEIRDLLAFGLGEPQPLAGFDLKLMYFQAGARLGRYAGG